MASVPHERMPAADALTSQAAAFSPETVRLVVLAVPETVMAVVDANGNCDAAAVEEAKKTPCVEIEVVVAAVVVANVEFAVNGYPKSAPAFVMVHWLLVAEYVVVMPEPLVSDVVPTPVHAPLANVSTCPAVPVKSVVVEIAVGAALAPVRLASRCWGFVLRVGSVRACH